MDREQCDHPQERHDRTWGRRCIWRRCDRRCARTSNCRWQSCARDSYDRSVTALARVTRMTIAPNSKPPPLIVEGFYSFQIGGSERLAADLVIAFRERGYRVIGVSFYD